MNCHTLKQVAVGAVVGSGTGALWYLLYAKVRVQLNGRITCCAPTTLETLLGAHLVCLIIIVDALTGHTRSAGTAVQLATVVYIWVSLWIEL